MLYSDFSIDLVLKRMAEVFNKKSTPTRICGVLLEAMEIIQQLRRAATPPPNDPLTLEELREMDGEPVYIVGQSGSVQYRGWEIFEKEICKVIYFRPSNRSLSAENYGKTWLAYRRKPGDIL